FKEAVTQVFELALVYAKGSRPQVARLFNLDVKTVAGRLPKYGPPSSLNEAPGDSDYVVNVLNADGQFRDMQNIQNEIVEKARLYAGGKRLQAAATLDISRSTLNRSWPAGKPPPAHKRLFLG
ncbi:MAG: hypothetical protein M3N08_06270, partial [Pseudomonadota bacterium]|nr:hypothetical protein [Pseudomonadota bacterium]